MDGKTEGRIVHFVLAEGQHRAAMIVRSWQGDMVNLRVFLDGTNDSRYLVENHHAYSLMGDAGSLWKTSVHYDEEKKPGTWHWIERDSDDLTDDDKAEILRNS
jgi:hypothetical protein